MYVYVMVCATHTVRMCHYMCVCVCACVRAYVYDGVRVFV